MKLCENNRKWKKIQLQYVNSNMYLSMCEYSQNQQRYRLTFLRHFILDSLKQPHNSLCFFTIRTQYQYSIFIYVLESSIFLAFLKVETKYLENERYIQCPFFAREQLRKVSYLQKLDLYTHCSKSKILKVKLNN